MQLEVRLFAMMREAEGRDRIALEVPDGITAGELKGLIAERHPRLARFVPGSRISASLRFVPDTYAIERAEEVALIPPVSGG